MSTAAGRRRLRREAMPAARRHLGGPPVAPSAAQWTGDRQYLVFAAPWLNKPIVGIAFR
jgi:hypothetical protein